MTVKTRLPFRQINAAFLSGFIAALALAPVAQARAPAAKPAAAKPAAAPAQTRAVSLDAVNAKLAELEANKGLAPEVKAKLVGFYQVAKERLEAAQTFDRTTADYGQAIAKAPAEIARLRQMLAQPAPKVKADEPAKLAEIPVSELEQGLADGQTALSALQAKLSDWEEQSRQQRERPAKARQELADARQNFDGLSADLKAAASGPATTDLAQAQRVALQAQHLARQHEIVMLEQELLSHDVRTEWLNLQREAAARDLPQAETSVKALEAAKADRQRYEAEQAKAEAERAEREALGKHPAVRALAEKNLELSRELTDTVDRTNKADTARDTKRKRAEQIEQDFESARQKLEIAGLSQALGQVLREQRRGLPDLSQYYSEAKERQKEVARVGLGALHLEEEHSQHGDIDGAVGRIMAAEVDPKLDAAQRGKIAEELRNLLKYKQLLTDRLEAADTEYLRTLGEQDFTERRLIDSAQKYATFLDERLLWIPSSRVFGLSTLRDLLSASVWLLAPSHWAEALRTLFSADPRGQSHWIAILAVLSFMALLGFQRQLKDRLAAISKLVVKPYSDRFGLTVEALAVTVLLPRPCRCSYGDWAGVCTTLLQTIHTLCVR